MRILFVSNTANFQKFNHPYMKWCHENGWTVDYACPDDEKVLYCDNYININMPRSPLHLIKIFNAINKLRKSLYFNNYDIIHCHTPVGAVVARIAGYKLWKEKKVKIIYTAHGFHFYKGSPIKNWIFFYPIEKFLANFTDVLITINREDFYMCQKKNFNSKMIVKFDGVGVNLDKFSTGDIYEKTRLRNKLGFSDNDFILLYIAEFIPRKNHEMLISVISELKKEIPNIKVLLPGKGKTLEKIKNYVKQLGLEDVITFLGYRNDISDLCKASDVYCTTSLQEGLPISVIEAMSSGLPLVVSDIRGQNDVVTENRNGFLFHLNDPKKLITSVLTLYKTPSLLNSIRENNIQDCKKFSVEIAVDKMSKIYSNCLNSNNE